MRLEISGFLIGEAGDGAMKGQALFVLAGCLVSMTSA